MSERLRRTGDVRAVLARGRAVHGAHAVTRYRCRGDDGPVRWTVSAGRRVGTAVTRNRAKRRLRAAVRAVALPAGLDLVVVARASAVTAPFEELRADVRAVTARVEQGVAS